jgi:peroxiredoxin
MVDTAAQTAHAGLPLNPRELVVGDPAPWFVQNSTTSQAFPFDTAAGRYLVLGFFLTASDEPGRQALGLLKTHRALFDDDKLCFFGVSVDPQDRKRLRPSMPGIRFIWDFDRRVSRLYSALGEVDAKGMVASRRHWLVLDPSMQVIGVFPITSGNSELVDFLERLPPLGVVAGTEIHAPVLLLSNVFEPEFCRTLIGLYEADGGQETGFMDEENGRTMGRHDPLHKRRRDYLIEPQEVREAAKARIARRIMPAIARAYQFRATRIERYLVACYDADEASHFAAHRDDTTTATAHRRFAVSINLNDDFEGGEIGFPEFGPRTYKPPAGGAVVFSCSLLHRVEPMRRGRRFAFLPFLYDEAGKALREANRAFLDEPGAADAAPGAA